MTNHKQTSRSYFLVYLSPLLLSCLVISLFVHLRNNSGTPGGDRDRGEDSYREVMELIESQYVDEVPREKLIYGALDGMAQVLDRYSRGYTPEEWDQFNRSNEGRHAGIGIRFGPISDEIRILHVVPGGPADRGGLKAGDRIVAVNGQVIEKGAHTGTVREKILGPLASQIEFELEAWGQTEARRVVIKRGYYQTPSVQSRMIAADQKTGYLRLSIFNQNTKREFRLELRKLRELGAKNYVLDLRQNPGGTLQAAVDVVACFLSSERVLTSVYREGAKSYATEGAPIVPHAPLAILIDGDTASASEVVVGALQDYKRAVVIGTRSYGKGLVQKIVQLKTRNAGLKLTTARYLTPAGRSLQRGRAHDVQGGIVPDFTVLSPKNEAKRIVEFWVRLDYEEFVSKALEKDANHTHLGENWYDAQLLQALQAVNGQALRTKLKADS